MSEANLPSNHIANRPAHRRIGWRDLFLSPGNFLAFGFGAGLAPIAPGTFGTLAAIPFFLLLNSLGPFFYLAALLVSFIAGVGLCARAAESLNAHDHPGIVWDEMVGLWVALFLLPFSWSALLLGFILFRLFDIAKPWPIYLIDRRLGGGMGIMLDDIVAGIFTNGALWLLLPYLP